jgi:Holliday junction resolvase RusA-like endonuclease
MISFALKMEPPTMTFQAKKIAVLKNRGNPRAVIYNPAELCDIREKFLTYLSPFAPKEPLKAPVAVQIQYNFPLSGRHEEGDYKTTKPDVDNAGKLLLDCMKTLGFFEDDSNVSNLASCKIYSARPCIWVRVAEMPKNTYEEAME